MAEMPHRRGSFCTAGRLVGNIGLALEGGRGRGSIRSLGACRFGDPSLLVLLGDLRAHVPRRTLGAGCRHRLPYGVCSRVRVGRKIHDPHGDGDNLPLVVGVLYVGCVVAGLVSSPELFFRRPGFQGVFAQLPVAHLAHALRIRRPRFERGGSLPAEGLVLQGSMG